VHRDDVARPQQFVERDQAHAHLRCAAGSNEGIERDDVHAERGQPLRDQSTDAAQPDDACGFLIELDAGELGSLPLAVLQRCGCRGDVPGCGDQEPHRQLGSADDVGLWRIDHHDASLGGRPYIDVVQAHSRPGDDLEPARGGEDLDVDLGRAADQDRVDIGDRGDQRGPIGAVAEADLEVRPERLDGRW
jgi:hypothetical protein